MLEASVDFKPSRNIREVLMWSEHIFFALVLMVAIGAGLYAILKSDAAPSVETRAIQIASIDVHASALGREFS
ncbi:MAG: hypothetical protein AAF219_01020 [Myxococcota bacterium]